MRVGDTIRTLPTTRPKSYANVDGVIATRNGDEWGVLVNGRLVWFLEKEIEECGTRPTTTATSARSRRTVNDRTQTTPTTGVTNAGTASSATSAESGGQTTMSTSAGQLAPDRRFSGPSSPASSSRPQSPPVAVSASPGLSDGLSCLSPGERGPGGGIVAQCVACGQMWERPKQRGRPSYVCRECR